MARLYRPHIPLEVRCAVIERQLFEIGRPYDFGLKLPAGHRLKTMLLYFSQIIGCEVKDLRLDHDPPLGARQKLQYSSVVRPTYFPDANDPKHLKYRPHGAQFDGSHDVKTRIRGEHGQFSDIALIKRERRRTKEPTAYQKRMAALKESQRQLQKERRRALKKKRGKPKGQGWRSRQIGSKKSPRRFGGQ